MSNDATQQLAPGDGKLWVAPVGTAAPTDPTTTPTNYFEIGYVSTTGVKVSDEVTMREQMAWQALYSIGRIVTGRVKTFAFEVKQWNKNNVALAWGGGTWTTPSTGVYLFTPPAVSKVDYRAFIFDAYDGTYHYRTVAARVISTENVESTWSREEDVILPITFAVTPASDSAAPYLFYTDNPAFS